MQLPPMAARLLGADDAQAEAAVQLHGIQPVPMQPTTSKVPFAGGPAHKC